MSAVLSEAENKFFSSGGSEVDSSLASPPEAQPAAQPAAPEPKPAEATPAAAAAPASEKTPETAPAQTKAEESRVPLEALHAERTKRQQVEQQLQQMQREWREFQEALRQAQQPQAPDPEQDPVGHLAFQLRQQQEELKQLREGTAQQRQEAERGAAEARFLQNVTAAEAEYAKAVPDYNQAAQFAAQAYQKVLALRYPDPAQRAMVFKQESIAALQQVVSQGGNPAEYVYNLAKSFGYTEPTPPPAITPPAPPAAPIEVPEAVRKIERGMKQQTNLSAGGSTPPSEITPEMAVNLNGKDFDKFWDQMKRSARR